VNSDDDNDADDQPATVAAGDSDATTVVPPPTEAAPELAWSADSGDQEDLFRVNPEKGPTWRDRLALGRGGCGRTVADERDRPTPSAAVRRSQLPHKQPSCPQQRTQCHHHERAAAPVFRRRNAVGPTTSRRAPYRDEIGVASCHRGISLQAAEHANR
jgi:hypothetical protein